MGKGKLFKAAATIAAIGGVCYVFRDKIKNSTVYQSLDMDDKVEKVKTQRRRGLERNGPEWGQRFFERWIPLENTYHEATRTAERCTLRLEEEP